MSFQQLKIDAILAATQMDFDEGIEHEATLFNAQVNSMEARAMRYAFLAERQAKHIEGVTKDTQMVPIKLAAGNILYSRADMNNRKLQQQEHQHRIRGLSRP